MPRGSGAWGTKGAWSPGVLSWLSVSRLLTAPAHPVIIAIIAIVIIRPLSRHAASGWGLAQLPYGWCVPVLGTLGYLSPYLRPAHRLCLHTYHRRVAAKHTAGAPHSVCGLEVRPAGSHLTGRDETGTQRGELREPRTVTEDAVNNTPGPRRGLLRASPPPHCKERGCLERRLLSRPGQGQHKGRG